MRYCTKCLMPETAESLQFDEEGVCSVCRQVEFKHTKIDWDHRRGELDKIVADFRGKGMYDCIVPFSGGKDSTFTLWYLVKKMKLKPLVVRFDHGFLRPTLQENALRTFRTLGVDVHHFTPNWQVVRKLMYESLKRRGDFCWHCHTGIFAYPMWVSLWQNIPLLVWGEPTAEYASFYSYDEHEEVDERRFNSFVNLGMNAEDLVGMLDNTISDYPVTERDMLPYTYPPMRDLRKQGTRSILLGSYIPWDVKEQVKLIKDELGWKGDQVEGIPPMYDYEKIECFMQGVRDYIKHLKRGFGRTTHLVSIDIRNNRLTRDEGAQLVEDYDGRRPAALDVFLEFLGITEQHFMDLIEPHAVEPHKTPSCEECQSNCANWKPWDYDQWPRVIGDMELDSKREASR
ncbi:N-acetyl sugar amidotransferase [Hwanghaeella grinnelliae]|uniref:N-acetyl sugar amidotransferase n=1 Tax=Hwanghaeella grinnelliae TaxID=2500179 RepID=A0A437QQN8_9PROT|nr:N-acetyl sugar amidotransferase [Hwanghaeella grinnelliae]RVU36767.1 N-acetyl sugar amidotransferase [Hwanghaeella grinnelliae]